MLEESSQKYEDIINLPYQKSTTRAHLQISDRAAQFAPFAALTGYDAAIREAARLTQRRIELDEYDKEALNRKLLFIEAHIEDRPVISVTYFQPDFRKSGGAYVKVTGAVKKLKNHERQLVLEDETKIPIDEILMLESESFCLLEME